MGCEPQNFEEKGYEWNSCPTTDSIILLRSLATDLAAVCVALGVKTSGPISTSNVRSTVKVLNSSFQSTISYMCFGVRQGLKLMTLPCEWTAQATLSVFLQTISSAHYLTCLPYKHKSPCLCRVHVLDHFLAGTSCQVTSGSYESV